MRAGRSRRVVGVVKVVGDAPRLGFDDVRDDQNLRVVEILLHALVLLAHIELGEPGMPFSRGQGQVLEILALLPSRFRTRTFLHAYQISGHVGRKRMRTPHDVVGGISAVMTLTGAQEKAAEREQNLQWIPPLAKDG